MAFLLALHEKMRLTRRKNQLILRQTRNSSKKERITKRIENVQKMYSKKIANIDAQAKQAQSSFSVWLNNQMGLGTGGLNPFGFGALGGMSQFVMNGMAQWAANGSKDKDGNQTVSAADATKIWAAAQSGGFIQNIGEDGKPVAGAEYKAPDGTTITKEQYQAYQAAMSQVQGMQQMAQYQNNMMTQQYQTNISIWQEAAKEELEAEQDAALAPLNELDTELDLEQQSIDTQLADVKARLESFDALVKDEIKNSAPTFGLG